MSAPVQQLAVAADPMMLAGVRPRSAAARDWQIVRWIGRIGVVTIEQLQVRFGLGRTVAYRRVAACVDAGLVERVETLRGVPALIRATRRGLRYTGLRLSLAQAPLELVGHWIACGQVAVALEREFGVDTVRSEREIRALERTVNEPIASAVIGEHADGSRKLHRADLAVTADSVVAVEVELTPKAPRRLEEIVRAWRRARWVESTRYYVTGGSTRAGLERAIARVHASERIQVLDVDDLLRARRGLSPKGASARDPGLS
jgi:hypothetical protein